jgi:molybdate transport system substrate-binding protein
MGLLTLSIIRALSLKCNEKEKKKMKRWISLLLALTLALALTACGSTSAPTSDSSGEESGSGENVELIVFAAASMQETLEEIAERYKAVAPNVTLIYSFESSGTLLDNIEAGADCDLFISAAPTQMNALDGTMADDAEKNPDGQDLLLEGTRVDLLENKVALAVPEGNPKGIESFDQLAQLLKSGDVFLAMGNSDVPVGQYTQKIFAYYGLDEDSLNASGVLTYGTNVKEVTSQVSEGAVDCGIIYATDAFSAGLTVVDTATAEMCGQVIYPAAVLKNSQHPEEAKAFLAYLQGDEAGAVFESVGFTPLT